MAEVNLSPYTIEAQQIERRRKMAELLSQQANQPMGDTQMAGGWALRQSPFDGLAKMLQAYTGAKGQEKAGEEMMALGQRQQSDRTSDMARLLSGMAPTPANPGGQIDPSVPEAFMPATPAKPAGEINPELITALRTPGMQDAAFAAYMAQIAPKTLNKVGPEDSLVDNNGNVRFRGTGRLPEFGTTPHYEKDPDGKTWAVYADKHGGPPKRILSNPMNQYTTATVDASNTLAQKQFQWANMSPKEKAELEIKAKALGISAAELYFNTGFAPANPGVDIPPAAGPMPQPLPSGAPRQPTPASFPRETPADLAGAGARQLAILKAEAADQARRGPVDPVLLADIAKAEKRAGGSYPPRTPDPLPVTTPTGAPPSLLPPGALPPKAATAAALASAEMDNKRGFNMTGLGDSIGRARALLTGMGGPPVGGIPTKSNTPTQSWGGKIWDAAGTIVGHNAKGADEAEKLRAIGGALVSKMPRMEGPQSDRDVENYQIMAGRVGDETIPVARRLAALDEVERLWAKYEKPANGKTLKFNPATGKIE